MSEFGKACFILSFTLTSSVSLFAYVSYNARTLAPDIKTIVLSNYRS